MLKKIKNSNKAFTLIELLVVISVIGLISTIATVSLNNARTKARDTKRLADINTFNKAMRAFKIDNGNYAISCNSYQNCYNLDWTPCTGDGCYRCYNITEGSPSSCTVDNYLTAGQISDPSNSEDDCNGNNTSNCQYDFLYAPSVSALRYAVYFYLESSTELGNSGAANCVTDGFTTICDSRVDFNRVFGMSLGYSCPLNDLIDLCNFWDSNGDGFIGFNDRNDHF